MKGPIRVGILGLGRAGRFMHAPELAQFPEFYRIVAGCDHAADRRVDLPKEFCDAKIYADYDEMLADPDVDMVTIATRNADHTPHALRALEAGKMAVVDKPCAISEAQADALLEADRKYPGRLFLRFNRRFEPAFQQICAVLDSGILGDISMIKIHRHPGYVRRCDWQTLTEFHGGMFNNWGPHFVDQALRLLRSPVRKIWCDLQHRVGGGDAEDQVKLVLTAENGCIADVEISTVLTIHGNLYEIWGSRGSLVIPADGLTLRMRYLDPAQHFTRLDGVRENFPLAYGNPNEELRFLDETRPIPKGVGHILQRGHTIEPGTEKPDQGYTYPDTMWYHLYRSLTGGPAYPITVAQGAEVVRTIVRAREISGFKPSVLTYPDDKD